MSFLEISCKDEDHWGSQRVDADVVQVDKQEAMRFVDKAKAANTI